jgi:hypothetical protein
MSSESRGCPAAAIIGIGCVMALYFIVSLMMTSGNQLGLLFRLILAGAALLGIWRPKAGVVLLLLMCGYTDLMKRLLVLVDKISYEDMTYVLATPPVLMVSLTVGTLAKCLGGSLKFGPLQTKSLGFITLCSVATLISSIGSYSGFSTTAQDLANGAAYSTFLLVIPLLFPDMASQMKLLKIVLIGYLPVAAYGVYQAMFGLAYFEVEYLKTGLSILISQLTTGEVRPFSTLNSPTALGAVCGMFALLAFLSGPLQTRSSTLPRMSALLVGICYVAGMIASTSRSDLFIIFAGAVMAFAALRRSSTSIVYGFALVSYVVLIFSAAWLQDRLANMQAVVSYYLPPNSVFIDQFTRVQTFSDRLEGFRHLVSDSRIWTLFGAGANVRDTLTSHDPLTSALLAHGVVPVTGAIVFLIALLTRVHRNIWALRDSRLRWMAAACLGTVWGLVATSMISGNRMNIFPVNVFMWLLLAMMWSAGAAAASAPAVEPIGAAGPVGFPPPPSRQRYPIRVMRRG